MGLHRCSACGFKAVYDRKPTSLLGRLWRWHAGWCPGWRAYLRSLPDEERRRIARHYGFKRFL